MKTKFFIRNDIDFIRNDISKSDKNIILNKLIYIFEKYYPTFDIEVLNIHDQIKNATNDLKYENIISLDCWYKNGIQFRFSRIFEYGGIQDSPIGYTHSAIPIIDKEKKYTIVDDDIYTGYTIKMAASILGLYEYNVYPMLKYKGKYDVVDVRDFIMDSEYGGLLTNKGRFIYTHPHVNLKSRASLDNNQINFSKDIIHLNNEIWKSKLNQS